MSPTPTKRVAIYARVATFDKGQDLETQLLQLREYAGRRGFDVAGEYVDYATGTNEDRANYQRLLDDVRKRPDFRARKGRNGQSQSTRKTPRPSPHPRPYQVQNPETTSARAPRLAETDKQATRDRVWHRASVCRGTRSRDEVVYNF